MAAFRRRLRLTLTNSQYRLLAFSLIYIFATVLVFAAALFLPMIIMLENRSLSPAEKQVVADQLLTIHAKAWPAILIVLVLLGIHSLIVSHRIAGPLYRFRCSLRAISDGNLSTPAIIRQNDYLVTEAETINEMITSLSARIGALQEQCMELHGLLSDLKRSIDSGSIGSMNHDIENLGTRIGQLKVGLDQFKTASVESRGDRDLGVEAVTAPASDGPPTPRQGSNI